MLNAEDDEGLYIDLPHLNYTKVNDDVENIQEKEDENENIKLMKSLQDLPKEKTNPKFQIFKSGKVIEGENNEDESYSSDQIEETPKMVEISDEDFSRDSDDNESSDDDSKEEVGGRARHAAEMYLKRSSNLQDVIYG